MKYLLFILCSLGLSALPLRSANAQHPVEVQQAYAKNHYTQSLAIAYQMARRRDTVESTVAAARSAWALGLPDEAQQWFQRALTFPGVTSHQQSDILFSLAAVLFTQHRYDEARLYAQRASSLAGEDSALVSQSLMLIGDVLVKEQRYGAAEREYVRALRHAKESLADELHYRLGKVHYELGNREQAAELLLRLPLSSERLPSALRILARIAVQDGDYKRARELLTQGRERFPNAFLDSWVELTFLRAAIEDANAELVQKIREEAKKQYPVGDPWLVLLEAEAEGWLWHLRNAAPGAESL